MDYKDTLNLPRTDFAMKADLVGREPERLKQWESSSIYSKIQAARDAAPKFILHDGPPFANGDVHIGTALNKILKDIIVKYKTLRGFQAPYIPGWDCHGLPIEYMVMQELRKGLERIRVVEMALDEKKSDSTAAPPARTPEETVASPLAVRERCEKHARRYIDLQRAQFKRLGVFGDWDHPYLTLDKEYEAEELRLFADLVQRGFVYRGKKPVYWSIPCRTALAEAEVEYKDHVSPSIYVKFPVVGAPGTFVLIWTTTPWTLPANLAVAYHKDFPYVSVAVGDETYLMFRGLLPAVAAKLGWTGFAETPVTTERLASLEYQHPFCNRTGKAFPADFVTSDTGTGFVHIAPGHGLDDYNLGRQRGLPIYSPVDDEGCLTTTSDMPLERQMPAAMIGKSILEKHGKSEANEAVLHELRLRHALLHQENYHHSYPHCWRSKTPVIFRAMDQWFVRIDHVQALADVSSGAKPPASTESTEREPLTFRKRVLREIDRVKWLPDWGVNRIRSAVESRPDWCISRQRSWGMPIPAFYDAQANPILEPQIVRNAADLIQKYGSNVWFEKSAAELWSLLKPQGWQGPDPATKSPDTLDVWIDSGSSSRSVLMRRPELGCPADLYLEGSDQHRGWFQSSLLLSLAGNGAAPFKTVLTHGFMVDADREKISKSKQSQGGYEKPQTAEAYVKKYGADVLRLWVASQDYRNDIIVSDERIAKVSEMYRVIRNALRYQLSNLYDFDPSQGCVPDEQLTGLDRWILAAFSKLECEAIAAYDQYEFHQVYQKVTQFIAVELSAVYHDVIKDRLYTDPANSSRRRSSQTVLYRLVTGLCRMLSPILSFTADEAWEFLPFKPTDSVHASDWQPGALALSDPEQASWKNLFAVRETVLGKLEDQRKQKRIGKSLEACVDIKWSKRSALSSFFETIRANPEPLRELLNVSAVVVTPNADEGESSDFDVDILTGRGQKCERCWHWETDVGANPDHPTICHRCSEAIGQLSTQPKASIFPPAAGKAL